MSAAISYRLMRDGEAPAVHALVRLAFDAAVAHLYSAEGVEEFFRYAGADAIGRRAGENCFVNVAVEGARLVGMIEMRNDEHVAMLFVDPGMQKRGIGRELLERGIAGVRSRNPGLQRVTVNSAPDAVRAYERFGFRATDEARTVNGIVFVQMEKAL